MRPSFVSAPVTEQDAFATNLFRLCANSAHSPPARPAKAYTPRMHQRSEGGGEELPDGPTRTIETLATTAGHAALVDALLELATETSRALDGLTRAPDVPDRAAATDHLLDTFDELLAPLSVLLAPRDLRAATAVIEAAANVAIRAFDFAACEVVPEA